MGTNNTIDIRDDAIEALRAAAREARRAGRLRADNYRAAHMVLRHAWHGRDIPLACACPGCTVAAGIASRLVAAANGHDELADRRPYRLAPES